MLFGWPYPVMKVEGKNACSAKAVGENVLMGAFVRMFNKIYENRQNFIKTMTENIELIILPKPDIGETEALDNMKRTTCALRSGMRVEDVVNGRKMK